MKQYQEGLNYLPLLTQNTTSASCGKSRMSLNRLRTRRSIVSYNGNYEGDSSMFRDKGFELERSSLVDTESDTDLLQRESNTSSCSLKLMRGGEQVSLAWRLVQFLIFNYLKPELREKVSTRIEIFRKSSFYHMLSKWAESITILFAFIFYFFTKLGTNFAALFRFMWRRRLIFCNLARRLLWRLTLAKCSDLPFFVLILFSIPVLLILSLIGFVISICGYFKDAINHCRHIASKI